MQPLEPHLIVPNRTLQARRYGRTIDSYRSQELEGAGGEAALEEIKASIPGYKAADMLEAEKSHTTGRECARPSSM
jgi:hypothetical protein